MDRAQSKPYQAMPDVTVELIQFQPTKINKVDRISLYPSGDFQWGFIVSGYNLLTNEDRIDDIVYRWQPKDPGFSNVYHDRVALLRMLLHGELGHLRYLIGNAMRGLVECPHFTEHGISYAAGRWRMSWKDIAELPGVLPVEEEEDNVTS